ncbi:facilitated trehalose transporter Tret1-2 homolog [Aphomia sociella]
MGVAVQVLTTVIVSMSNLFMGFVVAWPSYTLPVLESNVTGPQFIGRALTKHEGNLMSSVNMLGSLIAVLTGGFISETIGRKRSVVLAGLFYALSTTLLVTAKSPIQILGSRVVAGIGGGLHMVVVYVYINEFCQASIRGNMASLTILTYSIGTVSSFVCGWTMSYEVINYVMLIFTIVLIIFLCFLKESPIYLIRKKRHKEALRSFKFYRSGTTEEILEEFCYLKKYQDADDNETKDSFLPEDKERATKTNVLQILSTSKADRTALVTVTTHILLSVFMGSMPVQVYAGELFGKVAPGLPNHICSIILALVICTGSAVASIITDLVDRRVLMATSCGISTICLFLLSTLQSWLWAPDWIVACIILIYCCVYQVGATNIPFVQIAESFEFPEMKTLGSTASMIALCIGNFTVLSLFRPAMEIFGMSGTFLLLGFAGLTTTVTSHLIMKETRGVEFEVVRDMYEQGFLHRKSKVLK